MNWLLTRASRQLHREAVAAEKELAESRGSSREKIAQKDAERSAALHSSNDQAFGGGPAQPEEVATEEQAAPLDDPYALTPNSADEQDMANLVSAAVEDIIPTQLLSIAGPAVGDQQLGDPVLFGREDGSDGAFWGNAPGAKFNFAEYGKVWLAGVDKTPNITDAQAVNDDLYIKIDLENSRATVGTGTAPANSDSLEYYQIRRDGIQVQNSDIHESRTA